MKKKKIKCMDRHDLFPYEQDLEEWLGKKYYQEMDMKTRYLKTICKDNYYIIWKAEENDWIGIWNSSLGRIYNPLSLKRLLFFHPWKDWGISKKVISAQEAFIEML
jgi:hypothetical protein